MLAFVPKSAPKVFGSHHCSNCSAGKFCQVSVVSLKMPCLAQFLSAVKGINSQWRERMEVALSAERNTGFDIPQSRFGKYQAMMRHAIELDASFTFHQTFYRWVDGKRKTVVTKNITSVVDSMFKSM